MIWAAAGTAFAQIGGPIPPSMSDAIEGLLDESRYEEALAAAEEGLKADPSSADFNLGKIRALLGLGRPIEAARLAVPLAGRLPDRPEFRFYAGESAFQMAMIPQAVQHWSALIPMPGWSEPACRRAVNALLASGKEAEARALLEQSLARFEKPPVGILQLALGLARKGEEGVLLADRLAQADPSNKEEYEALKRLYASVGASSLFEEKLDAAYPVTLPLKEKSEFRDISSLTWGSGDVGTAGVTTSTRVVTPVSVNGTKEKLMLLDSGSDLCLVSPKWMAELGLQPVATAEYLGLGIQGAQKSNWVLLDSVKFGPLTLRHVPAMVISEKEDFFKEVGGIIPLSLLRHHGILYDRRHSKLVLHPSGTSPKAALGPDGFTVKSLWPYDRPFVETSVNGKPGCFFLVDTGAYATFIAAEKAKGVNVSINSARFGSQMGSGLSGAFASGVAADVTMVLGNTRLNMQTVQVTPLGGGWGMQSYGILGRRDVLDLFAMYFDYGANVVAFAPYDK
jgi:predicted aspartyl protease